MPKFYRVQLPGVMVLWMSGVTISKDNPLSNAQARAKGMMSSVISRARREDIYPEYYSKLKIFASHPVGEDYKIDIYTYSGMGKVSTKELNQQELYIAAGKIVPQNTPTARTSHAFRQSSVNNFQN